MTKPFDVPLPARTLIATLDLLGVTQMISNAKEPNDLTVIYRSIIELYENIARKGTSILQDIPEKVSERVANRHDTENICASIIKAIRTNFFSDTIVVSLNIGSLASDDYQSMESTKNLAVGFFFGYVKFIVYTLMANGFPVRGSIDSGDVLCGENLVVGRPYVNTLHISERLEFAGVVVTKEAMKLYNDHVDSRLKLVCPLIRLQIPVKDCYTEADCMNWLRIADKTPSDIMLRGICDIEQLLYEQFSANGKVMGESALRKLRNTAMTIRAFLAQNKRLSLASQSN